MTPVPRDGVPRSRRGLVPVLAFLALVAPPCAAQSTVASRDFASSHVQLRLSELWTGLPSVVSAIHAAALQAAPDTPERVALDAYDEALAGASQIGWWLLTVGRLYDPDDPGEVRAVDAALRVAHEDLQGHLDRMAEQDQGRAGQRLATDRTVSEPLRVGRARVRQLLDFVEEFLAATGEHA